MIMIPAAITMIKEEIMTTSMQSKPKHNRNSVNGRAFPHDAYASEGHYDSKPLAC